ncbi:MAG TPA: PD-(D/E)XK nuclease family protein [Campylobacterales bacterium]|nr:PD-(D/E)XK nuclease family protein [Campylobacterales bacterium]
MLVIYPTSRAIRARVQNELLTDGLLPKIISIGEFEKKAVVVQNRTFIDQDTRTQILNEASAFSTFKKLHIDREFFTFLKNSKFLFSFFDELSVELVDIKELDSYDTYGSYSEHIEILETLLDKYKQLLSEKNYIDKITLPSLYKINHAYLSIFEEIELHLEGYLNNFEFNLFLEIAKIVPIKIYITTNSFNAKMVQKFKELGIDLEKKHDYIIDLSNKSIISSVKNSDNKKNFVIQSCENQITQVAFIKKKIYDYINLGILPKDIAVILPNGSFAKLLDLFDDENNFNFAMGFSYKTTPLYQKLSAQYDYFTDRDLEGKHRLQRHGVDIEQLELSYEKWNKKLSVEELQAMFSGLIEDKDDEATLIYNEELHLFSKLFINLKHQPFHKLLHLFLNRLSTRTLDDTRGGKITVLEVLETRGVSFEAVIIVDFNEGVVPLSSQKDMFLSSELRFLAGLPTSIDRENLQKYYYQRVFDHAKEVSISYVEDEQNQPSRFLDELNIPKNSDNLYELDSILFDTHRPCVHYQKEDLKLTYDFSKVKLSATALKTYLDCKRSYYFKYIKKIEAVEIPKEENSDRIIGILLHDALKSAYEKKDAYFDEEELQFEIQSYLYQESEKQASLRFLVDLWLEKLKPFAANEIKRAKEGYKVKYIEEKFSIKHDGFTLSGQIDRVDQKDNFLEVIDYKSGKIPKDSQKSLENSSNFQLQFYHLLASQKGEVFQSYYYDLNNGNLIEDNFFDTKLDILYQKLEELKNNEHNFTMTDDMKKCTYCPYIKICDRIL